MRTLIIGLATAGLLATAANAQVTSHALVPGTDQLGSSPGTTAHDTDVQSPPLAAPGLQSGLIGKAESGSNDFPRARPDPGSLPGYAANTGSNSPVSATTRDYPLSWNGSAQDWTMHSRACAAKYKGYDSSSDMYTLRRGVKAMCPANTR